MILFIGNIGLGDLVVLALVLIGFVILIRSLCRFIRR